MLDLSLVVVQRIVTSQKPAIIPIRSPHTEFRLVSGATGAISIEIARRSFAVIRMNEQTRTKRKSGCLLPLFKTNAVVIERNAVGIKTFTTGSIYPHLLGREVQHLPELCFLPPDPFFGSLTLGDVRHRPDKLEVAGVTDSLRFGEIGFASPDSFFRDSTLRDIHDRAENFFVACLVSQAMCKIMKMFYRTVRHQQPMLQVKVTSALRRTLKNVFEKVDIVRMRSLQYQIGRWFRPGWISVNPSRFLGPEYALGTYFHSDTTGATESLRIC